MKWRETEDDTQKSFEGVLSTKSDLPMPFGNRSPKKSQFGTRLLGDEQKEKVAEDTVKATKTVCGTCKAEVARGGGHRCCVCGCVACSACIMVRKSMYPRVSGWKCPQHVGTPHNPHYSDL